MPSSSPRAFTGRTPLAFLALTSTLVVTLLLVPYAALETLRARVPLIGLTSTWLDALAPGVDMEHLVAFALLGALVRLAQVRPRPVLSLLFLAACGAATELAQALVPTRSPTADDLLLNVAGSVLGYACVALLTVALRPSQRRT